MNFKDLLYIGVRPVHRPSERRSIVLTNTLSMAISAAASFLVLFKIVAFDSPRHYQDLAISVFMLVPVVANLAGFVQTGQILLSWIATLSIYFLFLTRFAATDTVSMSEYDGFKIYLVGISTIPFLVLSLRKQLLFFLGASVPIIGTVFCDPVLYVLGITPDGMEVINLNSMRAIASAFVLSGSSLVLRKLVDKNEELSDQRYQELFKVNPVPMFIVDRRSLKFLDANEAALRLYGYR